jgi:hypothetical protein
MLSLFDPEYAEFDPNIRLPFLEPSLFPKYFGHSAHSSKHPPPNLPPLPWGEALTHYLSTTYVLVLSFADTDRRIFLSCPNLSVILHTPQSTPFDPEYAEFDPNIWLAFWSFADSDRRIFLSCPNISVIQHTPQSTPLQTSPQFPGWRP